MNVKSGFDLTIKGEFDKHANFIEQIGNDYMAREFKEFIIDKHNRKVLKFLVYYFNNCKLAEDVFLDRDYKIHKNIMLVGAPGVGKTMIMQIFSDYLRLTKNPNYFYNLSTTQMMNYCKINGHIDRYTYNEADGNSFNGNPVNVCLNDIGLEALDAQKSYGTDLGTVVDEFLFARDEIYKNQFKKYHLTSNMNAEMIEKRFDGRLIDRFKNFNRIVINGNSKR